MASVEQLFNDNIKLVYYVVHKRFNRHDQNLKDDLVQEGLLALYNASKNFDVNRNIKFSTLAYKYIHTACRNYLCKNQKYYNIQSHEDLSYIEDGRTEYNLEDFRDILDDKHFQVLEMRIKGFTDVDISKETKYSKEYVRQIRKQIGEQCKKLLKF